MHHKRFTSILKAIALLSLVLGSGKVLAQNQPPAPPIITNENLHPQGVLASSTDPGDDQVILENSQNIRPGSFSEQLPAATLLPPTTGGPDNYGYTWDASVPYNWIDASVLGTNSNVYGGDVYTGPLDLGFTFPYYENNYNQLYFSTKGLVSFSKGGSWYNNTPIPNPVDPTNIILPFWDDLGMYKTTSRPDAGIFYLEGGTPGNHYFVIEWKRADIFGGTTGTSSFTDLTFEVILYESGDILMQYANPQASQNSATVGIEDSTGRDGLQFLYNAPGLANGTAIRFYRPTLPSARVIVWPSYQGNFTHAGEQSVFQLSIRNTGQLGSDTYDLTSSSSWPVSLYAADGTTLLIDTNGNNIVDTGAVAEGSTITVTAKIQTPTFVNVGNSNSATLTIRSSKNNAKTRTITLNTAIPAAFAQVYTDAKDGNMSLNLVMPASQTIKAAQSGNFSGSAPAIIEASNGNLIYSWNTDRCLDNTCKLGVSEIYDTIFDHDGNIIHPMSKLFDLSSATMNTFDSRAVLAVNPTLNGQIGMLWGRLQIDSEGKSLYNVYFAILDSSGNIIYQPQNLTNNTIWGNLTTPNYGVPTFESNHISATDDGRFVLTWVRHSKEIGGDLYDVYLASRDTSGNEITPPTALTTGIAGSKYYYAANSIALQGGKVLVIWDQKTNDIFDTYYTVLDSAGTTIIKTPTGVGKLGTSPDAVQLSNGNILIALTMSSAAASTQINYFILDSTYSIQKSPTPLSNPGTPFGNDFVSVATDQVGHVILTWMDPYKSPNYHPNLYYTLLDNDGTLLTPPMIFRTAQYTSGGYFLQASDSGYGCTSYTITPTFPGNVDLNISSPAQVPALNSVGVIPISFSNSGKLPATNVKITATLDPGITYVSDDSGFTPTINGNQVSWSLPSGLDFLGYGQFPLRVSVPALKENSITLQITSSETDGNPSNNVAVVKVQRSQGFYLPLISRGP